MIGRLRAQGVLGMNARIGGYLSPLNARKHYPLVDDKIRTSLLAKQFHIPMPEIYHVFSSYGDTKHLAQQLAPHPSFVIKPARGAMGNGIIVIDHSEAGFFYKIGGSRLNSEDIRYHILQIISGLYSLSGYPDQAILQYRVNLDPVFREYAVDGVPDVRIVVYCGFPIMAMIRLPTYESDGRANLHQGAVGAGIDMVTGTVHCATHKDRIISYHPDTQKELTGLTIPHWEEILAIAAKCYDITQMGYLGVDIVLDRDLGPMVLEMNARPGLSIQIANRRGLRKVLDHFKPYTLQNLSIKERLKVANELNSHHTLVSA